MTPLKAAVIGLGVGKVHARALAKLKGVELAAVADPKGSVAADLAKELGVRAYGDGMELLEREKLDLACVCTPPASHLKFTREVARRGTHVFCEKPMAPSLGDCDGMIAACKQHGVLLMIGQKKRFHPSFRLIKERTASDFGPIRWAAIRYACGRVPMDWFWDERDGGGPLHENSVHAMDILRHLIGEVERVYAEGGNFFNPTRAPQLDSAAVSLRFTSGAVASVGCGQAWEWSFSGEGTWLAAERAVIEVTGGFDSPGKLRYLLREGPQKIEEVDFGDVDLFDLELAHFVECIQKGTKPLVTGEEGRGSIAVCLAVKESIRTGKAVRL